MIVIPILVGPCTWDGISILESQEMLDGKPLTPLIDIIEKQGEFEQARERIIQHIRMQIRKQREQPLPRPPGSEVPSSLAVTAKDTISRRSEALMEPEKHITSMPKSEPGGSQQERTVELPGGTNEIIALGLNNVIADAPSEIIIFNLKDNRIIKTLNGLPGVSIEALGFNQGNNFLISGSRSAYVKRGGSIRIYNFMDNLKLVKYVDFKTGGISDLAISGNGKIMASSHIEPEPIKGYVTRYSVGIWNGF